MHETLSLKRRMGDRRGRRRKEEGEEEVVVKSLKTGVHTKGRGFHTLKFYLVVGSSRPW